MTILAGIDVGTSRVKAVATTPAGQLLGSGSRPTPWQVSCHGTHADPGDMASAAFGAVRDALDGTSGRVAGVGVTGMAESGVLLNDRSVPCVPVVAWHDMSGAWAEEELRSFLPDAEFGPLTGQQITRRLTAVKYRDLRRQAGDRAGRGWWMTIPEWIVHSLGGRPAPELSQWSRTGFLAIDQPAYARPVADWAGLPWHDYPDPVPAGTPAGKVPPDHGFARLRGAVLTTAGHDHLCAAVGVGVLTDDDVTDSWGNGEAVLRSQRQLPDIAAALRCGFRVSWHVLPDRHVLLRGLSSGIVLRRVLSSAGCDAGDRGGLDARAAEISAGDLARQLSRAAGNGLQPGAAEGLDPAFWWRAALEDVFSQVRSAVADLNHWGPVRRVVACGGWLASGPIAQLKLAAVPGMEISPVFEPAAAGAACMAGVAAGIIPDIHSCHPEPS
jgi:sugar (pentulose or hexulose) kinase